MSKRYTMDDLQPIIDGKVPLPNFKEQPLDFAVSNITACCGNSIRGLANMGDHPKWAQFWLGHGQGGGLQGDGYVLIYTSQHGKPPLAGTFAICDHEAVEDPGANHMRGWHPAHCKKCGLDLTVDSGD